MIVRVELPYHLRNLAKVDGEVQLELAGEPTLAAVLDALEQRHPVLRGTIREHGAEYAADADEWFWTGTERLRREWASGRRVFLATSRRKLTDLEGALDPEPRVLARDHDRLLVVNFDAPGSEPLAPLR